MTVIGTGEVPVIPTFRGFRSTTVREVDSVAAESGGRFSSVFGTAIKGIGAGLAVGLGAAIAGIGAIASKGLKRSLDIQDAKAQLDGLGHSAETVDTVMANALASVKGTAFGLGDAATIAASAVAAGIKPGEALTRTLTATANAAAIGKTSLSEMGGIINKVATSGKLNTEVLNQFSTRGIPLLQAVAAEYGVTAEEASKMVSKGKVDFETFQTALEKSVGTGAAAAGQTARGSFQNIGAAFGRLGAMFVGSAVDGAPTLFQSIAAAVDRAAEALKPYAEAFGSVLTPAITNLAFWIDRIDFGKIVGGLQGAYDLVVGGKFSTAFREAFNQEEDSRFVSFVLGVRNAISGLYSLVVKGQFTAALRNAFNIEEDSGFVTFVLGIRDAIGGLVSSLGSGDFSGAFSSIGKSLTTLQPAFAEFGSQLPKIGQAASTLVAAGLSALTQGLSFLADNVDTVIAFMPLIVAGFIAWRVASTAVVNASLALRAGELASAPVYFANNVMRLTSVRIERQLAIARGQTTVATNVGMVATARSTVSLVASRVAALAVVVAQRAMAVAQGIATAAQWAFNAALTANPIGIIIALIVALVAGLVYFFTQTELGQQVWANFTKFLGEAWANIVAFATSKFTELGNFFSDLWSGIVAFVTFYVESVRNTILKVVTFIVTAWNAYWSAIGAFFSGVWNGIVSFVKGAANNIASAVLGFVNGVRTNIQNVVGFVRDLPGKILGFLGNIGGLLVNKGRDLIQGFIDGIKGMIGNIGKAIGGVLDFAKGFFPSSPAKRGPFSGAGWMQIGQAGKAIIDEFNAGFPADSLQLAGSFAMSLDGRPGRPDSSPGDSRSADRPGAGFTNNGTIITQDVDEFFAVKAREERRALALEGIDGSAIA